MSTSSVTTPSSGAGIAPSLPSRAKSIEPLPIRLLRLVPGLLLLAAVGFAGKVIEQSIARYGKAHHLTLPNIEYVLWAILIGLVLANTVGLPKIFVAGVATYDFWLKVGIVLLGSRFLVGDVLRLGGISLGLVAIEITLALALMHGLGRAFRLKPKLTSLLAVGSAVCGVSAIIATQGAIDADEEESSTAIAAILALGALSLFTFPLIAHSLHLSDHAYGLWAGLAVDNTAEATAAGALYSDVAGRFAVLVKTTRNAMIGFVVLGYALYWSSRGQAARGQQGTFPVAEVSALRAGLSADLAAGKRGGVHQAAVDGAWEPVAVGVPADLCGCGAAHEHPRVGQAGMAAAGDWGARRGGDCCNHAGAGVRSRPAVPHLRICHPGRRGTGRSGDCAFGACGSVRFLWFLTLGVAGDLVYPMSQLRDMGHPSYS
jgi:uncharacterized integral membrane protein (TIGR00698 family)